MTEITFSGTGPATTARAGDVTVLYVGNLVWPTPEMVAQYPALRTHSPLEMGPARTYPNGSRYAPLIALAPGFTGLGSGRVATTLDHPHPNLTLLRTTAPIPPGRYIIACGPVAYELVLE